MTTAPLTEHEQQALEQMREAQEQGSTLKDYAAKTGTDVRRLYELRRRLVRKGVFGALPRRKVRRSRKEGAFVPVRVVPGGSGRVPVGAPGWLGARVRWTAAGFVDHSGVDWRGTCCAPVHRI